MRILIATPLYPPDIADTALYVKELATRLSIQHEVTILAYSHIPEAIPKVRIVTVEKSAHLFARLIRFTKLLFTLIRSNEVVLAQNGPSVEIPLFLVHFFSTKKIIFEIRDIVAYQHTTTSFLYRIPFLLACFSAHTILSSFEGNRNTRSRTYICTLPRTRPEILPFSTYPEEAFRLYEDTWGTHVRELTTHFVQI